MSFTTPFARPHRTRRARALVGGVTAATALTVLLAGCAPEEDTSTPTPSPTPTATATVTPTPTAPPEPIFSADVFDAPEWTLTAASTPVVGADRLVWVDDGSVVGVDAEGEVSWSTALEVLDKAPRPPFLRMVDRGTIAAVQEGTVEGSGLSTGGPVFRVWLIDLDSGNLLKTVDVPNEAGMRVDESGLGVVLMNEARTLSAVVSPRGDVRNVETGAEGHYPVAGVGEYIVWMDAELGSDGRANLDTLSLHLPAQGDVVFGDLKGVVAVEAGGSTSWVDLGSGQVFATAACGGDTNRPPVLSPNGRYAVAMDAVVDLEGRTVTCVTTDEDVVSLPMTAVTDEGVTLGIVPLEGTTRTALAVADASGVVSGFDLTEQQQAAMIVGVLDGLVVHYDRETGLVTANPLLPAGATE